MEGGKGGIAAANREGTGVKAGGGNGGFDREDGGERAVLHLNGGGAELSGLERFAEHPGNGLGVELHDAREEGLIVADGSGIAFAWACGGDIGGGEHVK